MAHVEQIAERPHFTGSADHARVRDYLVAALERLGLKPQVQTATVMQPKGRLRIGRVENVLARIPGTSSTGAVLLASHYDSVPAAPGRRRRGIGRGRAVEAVRALKAGGPLRNDIIVLITDGEEIRPARGRGVRRAAPVGEGRPRRRELRGARHERARRRCSRPGPTTAPS